MVFPAGLPGSFVPGLSGAPPGPFLGAGHTPGAGTRPVELYEVVHKVVALRSGPSVESKPVGKLAEGNRVRGQLHIINSDPWLRLSPQMLPAIGRDIQPKEEIWSLIDASRTNLGVGELLRKVSDEELDPQDIEQWKVVHTKVGFRKEPSLRAEMLGYHKRGDIVEGVPQNYGGMPWLKSNRRDEKGRAGLIWTLIDGSPFGLGSLLKAAEASSSEEEQPPAPKAKPKAKGKARAQPSDTVKATGEEAEPKRAEAKAQEAEPRAKAAESKAKAAPSQAKVAEPKAKAAEPKAKAPEPKAQAAEPTPKEREPKAKVKAKPKAKQAVAAKAKAKQPEDLGDLSKWLYAEGGIRGRYRVVHQQVVIRSMPSIKAKMKGIVMKGDFIEGECRDEWLLMDWEVAPLDLQEGNGRWLLINGSSLGFGMLLERVGDVTGTASWEPAFDAPTGQVPTSKSKPEAEAARAGAAAEAKGPPEERLPRVVCLHGAASGRSIFTWQVSLLAKRAKGIVDLVILEGPRDCTDSEAVEIMSCFFAGKPMKMFDEISFDERNWPVYKSPRAALKWLQDQLHELAPVDAVLGFSQGADFAAMLAAQASANQGAALSSVLLLSPHAPGYAKQFDDLFSSEVTVPALILRGEQEGYGDSMKKKLRGKVIDKMGFAKPSEHVARLFKDPEVHTHRDGHRPLPEDKAEAENFVEHMLKFVVRHARRSSGGLPRTQASSPSELKEGASVRLVGLQSVAHLNNQEGTLQRFDVETERWVVSMQSSGEQVMLRERNLEVIRNVCMHCDQAVGFKKDENGDRYCAKCWAILACTLCKKAVGTEKDEGKPFCTKCWTKRMCVECTTSLGEVEVEDGRRYCRACWDRLCCSECQKVLASKWGGADKRYCPPCWLANVCCRCEQSIGERRGEDRSRLWCAECWDVSSCVTCRKRLGEVRDTHHNYHCGACWDDLACVICRKTAGALKDERGDQHCYSCWEKYRICVRCRQELGTVKENGSQYCGECWYLHTLCVKCEANTGEPRQAEGFMRFCHGCWAVRERERLQEARRGQAQLFRDLLSACQETAQPPPPSVRPGPPELPRDAAPFLERFGLGPPEGLPRPEASVPSTPRPQPSPAQGTCRVDGGDGLVLELTSAFDGGNALVEAWALEPSKGGLPTFSTRVAPDFKASGQNLRAFDQARQYWFNFGVAPADPVAALGARIRLKVGGMMRQEDLFDDGYAPVCHSPSMPMWRRVDEGSVEYRREKDAKGETTNTMAVSWLHTFEEGDVCGTTYFAFCYPFSFTDLQGCLARLEHVTAAALAEEEDGRGASGSPASMLGCLHQLHTGCAYFPFGQHSLETPRIGRGIYFHRQLFARSPQGRTIEMITVTEAPSNPTDMEEGPRDELPEAVQNALKGWPSAPPLIFKGRQICFASGRVHPGETPGQFAFLGLLQFVLSDDPRAALLRKHFVFKLIPMMNPDGVAWGHSRTNSLGFDLNRCYAQPTADEHEVVFAVKAQLQEWAGRGDLRWYTDMHAHAKDRGCFLYGNLQPSDDEFCWSVAYGHAVQMNCPHVDIDKCLWSTAPAPKADQPDYDSGRGQMGRCCKLPLAYTLECNYNTGRLCRPVVDPPSLPAQYAGTQTVREYGVPRDPAAGGRFLPVSYDPCSWAAVGEALAVSILDMQAGNPHSRLLAGRPPKLIAEVGGRSSAERAHQHDVLCKLSEIWDTLEHRHRQTAQAGVG